MNPLTNIRSRQKQREQEVINGVPESASYHSDYRTSAYIYAGQLSFNLTEGDLLAIFSQFGEIVDVNLVRDKNTKKSRGFAFLAYDDQRSTDLAVDNLNGITVDGRVISVDHVKDYKRLVENPDYVDTRTHQVNDVTVTAQEYQAQQPAAPILSGAEAEAIEDELGTNGMAEPAQQSSTHRTGQRATAPGAGASSIAEMLREVEAYVGDWRRHGVSNAPASNQEIRGRHGDDPMAGNFAAFKVQKEDERLKHRRKHKQKTRRQDSRKCTEDRHRSRSPRPH